MTGYSVNILRGENVVTLDIDELTDQELNEFFGRHISPGGGMGSEEYLADWAKALARWIRDRFKSHS